MMNQETTPVVFEGMDSTLQNLFRKTWIGSVLCIDMQLLELPNKEENEGVSEIEGLK